MFNTLRVLEYQFKDTFPIEFKRWENQIIYLIIITFEKKGIKIIMHLQCFKYIMP